MALGWSVEMLLGGIWKHFWLSLVAFLGLFERTIVVVAFCTVHMHTSCDRTTRFSGRAANKANSGGKVCASWVAQQSERRVGLSADELVDEDFSVDELDDVIGTRLPNLKQYACPRASDLAGYPAFDPTYSGVALTPS